MFKKEIIFAAFVLGFASLSADWIPEECLPDLEAKKFEILEDSDYKALKGQVIEALKQSWCTEEKAHLLMDLTTLLQPKMCVEIGAFTGSTVLPVAVALKKLGKGRLFAIDAWSNKEAIKHLPSNDPNKSWWSSISMPSVKAIYDALIRTWELDSVCTTLHFSSEEASKLVDGIDFLHLDGNFSELGALKDVQLYLPKVKQGGYILLSNLFLMSNGKQPKLKSFCALFDECEMVCEIEKDNAVLFKKQ